MLQVFSVGHAHRDSKLAWRRTHPLAYIDMCVCVYVHLLMCLCAQMSRVLQVGRYLVDVGMQAVFYGIPQNRAYVPMALTICRARVAIHRYDGRGAAAECLL